MKINRTVLAVLGIALWLPCLFLFLAVGGCQSGTTGLFRPVSPSVEHAITNGVPVVVKTVDAVAPFPYNTVVDAGGAAVLALLAAWQGFTHTRATKNSEAIASLKKGPPE
jgi:hypothetical protein